ncbi:histone-lysine N-methyltransferase SETMAR-like [Tetranychus urticae]|uniref:histone-lysine N-methyltransferase SETMAR-like n=1 Tax=Tetranychus urticae TaxID=32264 RepID=UPI00077BCD02|nr:histone-lysine N-methyltransferase SETMAR-like [Tetranychus urticae]
MFSIVKEHVGAKKLTPTNIPHVLNDHQKRSRVNACAAFLSTYNRQPNAFLACIFTCDETWLSIYETLSRTESMKWVTSREQLSKKPTSQRNDAKVMANVFWDSREIIKIFWMPPGQTVNGEVYRNQLREIAPLVGPRRPPNVRRKPLFLHNNARPHVAEETMQLIQELGWGLIQHPPYSPDLAPSDYFLFKNLKQYLRGRRFESISELIAETEAYFASQPESWYRAGIAELPTRYQRCLASRGDYLT